ncbi:MAG TPA: hypothetical protein VFL17_01695 [Anaerolineae bacterium]|nr:hypothetical protein [Anaerolineae bacterium]
MLSIHLLGTPRIQRDGEPIYIIRRKSRALVYYLATHDKPLTREHLVAFFWPDLERASVQQTLRTTQHGLRRLLGSALVVDEDTLAWRRIPRSILASSSHACSLTPACDPRNRRVSFPGWVSGN